MKIIKNSGITLISLIVTIIILIILVGVTLSLIGQEGIITKAQNAVHETKRGQYAEQIEMMIAEERIERAKNVKEEPFIESLKNRIEDLKYDGTNKNEKWVTEILMTMSDATPAENPEEATNLIIGTIEGYDLNVEVNNSGLWAKVLDTFTKSDEKYTVKFVANGGIGEEKTVEIRKGFSIILEQNLFTNIGFKFVGWCEEKDGSGTKYSSESAFKPQRNTTLYAIWEEQTVFINFNSNEGQGEMASIEITPGSSTILSNNTFSRTGYLFKEWNTKADGSGTKYIDGATISAIDDTTLYAIWDENVTVLLDISNNKFTEGTTIMLGGTALANGIQKVELKVGENILYSENVGNITYSKLDLELKDLSNLANISFYECTATAIVTSTTGKTSEISVNAKNYTVSTATQLKKFAEIVNSGNTLEGETIVQLADIDLNSGKWSTNSQGITTFSSSAEQWKVIGQSEYDNDKNLIINEKKFCGLFDGNNYTINGLYIKNEGWDTGGLFGNNYGTIKNTILKNSSIDIRYLSGGIASGNRGNINNCKNYAFVKGNRCVGGICSWSEGTIENCINYGKIEGDDFYSYLMSIGGIVGWGDGTINNCGNYGTIYLEYAYSRVGIAGINGMCNVAKITNCYNYGQIISVTGNDSGAGGILGVCDYYSEYQGSTISKCYNKGSVSAVDCIGGILSWGQNVTIIDCYNTGNLISETRAGGITLWTNSESSIINCYNVGNVSTSETNRTGALYGHWCDGGEPTLTNNYVVLLDCRYAVGMSTTGWNDWAEHIETKTASEMKLLASTLGCNWKADLNNINNGYPILNWQ